MDMTKMNLTIEKVYAKFAEKRIHHICSQLDLMYALEDFHLLFTDIDLNRVDGDDDMMSAVLVSEYYCQGARLN